MIRLFGHWKSTIFLKNKKLAHCLLFLYKIFIQFNCFHNVQTKLRKTTHFFLNAVEFDHFTYFDK